MHNKYEQQFTGTPAIAVFASDQQKMNLWRFILEHQVAFKDLEMWVTGGTFNEPYMDRAADDYEVKKAKKEAQRFIEGRQDKRLIKRLRGGSVGGIIEIANAVVIGKCRVLIFFTDPNDERMYSQENGALIRVCTLLGAKLLINETAATQWVNDERDIRRNYWQEPYPADGVYPPNWRFWKPPDNWKPGNPDPKDASDETVALIAHNKMKADMIRFVKEERQLLKNSDRIRYRYNRP